MWTRTLLEISGLVVVVTLFVAYLSVALSLLVRDTLWWCKPKSHFLNAMRRENWFEALRFCPSYARMRFHENRTFSWEEKKQNLKPINAEWHFLACLKNVL